MPLFSSVAVWKLRAVFRLPVGVKVPVAGLYSSALAKGPLEPGRPQSAPCRCSAASPCGQRAVFRLPVGVKVPVAGLYSSALAK